MNMALPDTASHHSRRTFIYACKPAATGTRNGVNCEVLNIACILELIYSRCKALLPFLSELRRCGAYTRLSTPVFATHGVPGAVLPLFMQATSVKTLPSGWIAACKSPGHKGIYLRTLSGTTSLPSFASHLSQTILYPRMPCGRGLHKCTR